jgi:DNA-binding phage protein
MPRKTGARNVIDQLKDAIRRSGRTLTDIGRDSGVGIDRLSRFVRGERDLTGEAIGKVCKALGLELGPSPPPTKSKVASKK